MVYSTYMIPERIRELRSRFDWSQSELSRQLGVTRASVNAWEQGLSMPTTQYLVAMCKLFHVSADYLLGLERKPTIVLEDYTDEELSLIMNLIQYIDSQHAESK